MGGQPTLLPLDVAVALRMALRSGALFSSLAEDLGIGVSAAYRSVKRLEAAGLVLPHERMASRSALREFLLHGVRYAFYPVFGPAAPGVPTAHAAPPLSGLIVSDRPLVWPCAKGTVRGDTLMPLYGGASGLVGRDPEVYEALALVDAIRAGRARERKLAAEFLEERLRQEVRV